MFNTGLPPYFQTAQYAIVIEEDLDVSPDFFK